MTKIWNEAFWKHAPAEADLAPCERGARRRAPLYVPVVLMTALGVTLGMAPEPLLAVVRRAAAQLADPTEYVRAVLGEGRP